VLDAAYAEYVDRTDYDPGTLLVACCDNVVMTRTFSKMFGMGGMRLGWAYAPPAVIDVLNRARAPFNVSLPAHEAGIAALAEPGWVEKSLAHNTAERGRVASALAAAGIMVHPSQGNFVLADFGTAARADAADIFLRGRAIIVRRVAGYGLPHCLRITIGLADENDALIEGLRAFQAGANA
jgi:histidinol-phosphate aminotransferase